MTEGTTVADRHAAWCERHYKIKGAEDFKLDGDFAWVREKFFAPAFGWRLMPQQPASLCNACRGKVGSFVEWSPEVIKAQQLHRRRKKGCTGLVLTPVSIMVQNLCRGDGKTSNTFALVAAALADPALAPLRIQFMASAESQTLTLMQENLLDPVRASKLMGKRFRVRGNKVEVDHKHRGKSYIEFVATAHRSLTGRRRGVLLVDEAKDVDTRSVTAMLPSLRSTSRFACPRGHAERPYRDDEVHSCPTCGDVMLPHVPRVWLTSTSGFEDGGEAWFNELVEVAQQNPSPLLYLHRSEIVLNPKVAQVEDDVLDVFTQVESMRPYLAVELTNTPAGKGDHFVTRHDLEACVDKTVENLNGSSLPCVGFLDTSWSGDLTTLMLAGWDQDECDSSWEVLRVLHWKIWAPKAQARGVIDPEAVWAYFDEVLELFPGLEVVLVDDRGSDWAKELVVRGNRERARTWGRLVRAYHGKRVRQADGRVRKEGARLDGVYGGEDDRIRSWQLLEQRLGATVEGRRRLALPAKAVLPELHAELLGVVRKVTAAGGYEITDRNRKRRHADVAECLAGCCLLAYLRSSRHRPRLQEMQQSARDKALADFLKPVTGGVRPKGFF